MTELGSLHLKAHSKALVVILDDTWEQMTASRRPIGSFLSIEPI
jgi:hypothetical protein